MKMPTAQNRCRGYPLSVVHADGLAVQTQPSPGLLKAAFDALKGQLAADGFTEVEYRALNWARSPVGFVSRTYKLR